MEQSRSSPRPHGLCRHQTLYADGRLEGELRLVGLFTSGAYTRSVRQIPYIRLKVAQCSARRLDPDSHSGKAALHILEEYPRDELVQVDAETLYNFLMEILTLYERSPRAGRCTGR